MMYWDGDGMRWWGYLLMSLSMIAFWGLMIGDIIALVRYFGRVCCIERSEAILTVNLTAGSPSGPAC